MLPLVVQTHHHGHHLHDHHLPLPRHPHHPHQPVLPSFLPNIPLAGDDPGQLEQNIANLHLHLGGQPQLCRGQTATSTATATAPRRPPRNLVWPTAAAASSQAPLPSLSLGPVAPLPPRYGAASGYELYQPALLPVSSEHSLRRKTPRGTIEGGYDGTLGPQVRGPPSLKHPVLQGPPGGRHGGRPGPIPGPAPYLPPAPRFEAVDPGAGLAFLFGDEQVAHAASSRAAGSVGHFISPAQGTPASGLGLDDFGLGAAPFTTNGILAPPPGGMGQAGPSQLPPHRFYDPPRVAGHFPPGPAMPDRSLRGDAMAGVPRLPGVNHRWAGAGGLPVGDGAPAPPDYVLSSGQWDCEGVAPTVFPPYTPYDAAAASGDRPRYVPFQPSTIRSELPAPAPGPVSGLGLRTTRPTDSAALREAALAQAGAAYDELMQQALVERSTATAGSRLVPPLPRARLVYPALSRPTSNLAERNGARGASHGPPSDRSWTVPPALAAHSALELLRTLCQQTGWNWVDGVLLGGCLLHLLGQYKEASEWFSTVATLDSSRVEAISNLGAALYCLGRHGDAEAQWLKAVRLRPDYLDPTEHLVSLLYKKRGWDAVKAIDFVQQALRIPSAASRPAAPAGPGLSTGPPARGSGLGSGNSEFGSSGYALPAEDNHRILALVHVKATLLHRLGDAAAAVDAFEDIILISTARTVPDLWLLAHAIQAALIRSQGRPVPAAGASPDGYRLSRTRALLLPPSTTTHTAHLVFGLRGDLPGLRRVCDPAHRRIALVTASNALVFLAMNIQGGAAPVRRSPPGRHPGSFGPVDILSLYYLSLSLNPTPSTANNVGIMLSGLRPPHPAPAPAPAPVAGVAMVPDGAAPPSQFALAYYRYGLELDPGHAHLLTNYATIIKEAGHFDAAIRLYELALARDPDFGVALTNLGNAVKDKGNVVEATTYYRRAFAANPDLADAACGLATCLHSVCDWRGRGGALLENGRYDRWHVGDDGSLLDVRITGRSSGLIAKVATALTRQLAEASGWGSGLLAQPGVADQLARQAVGAFDSGGTGAGAEIRAEILRRLAGWAGRPWEGSRVVRFVERAIRAKMRQWYLDRRDGRESNEPAAAYARPRLPACLSAPATPTVLPFHTFTYPLPARDIRAISHLNALRVSCSILQSPSLPETVYRPPPPPSPHLNVGYVSSDFSNHPLAHLMQSVFGFHDPTRVRAICYATAPSDRSTHRLKIEQEAPVFRDVTSWPSHAIIDQIVRDEIHILVNLNGYTRGARNEIFAARPAPVQMAFMGFAGSLGAEWCDYIMADGLAIPATALGPRRSGNSRSLLAIFDDDVEGYDGDGGGAAAADGGGGGGGSGVGGGGGGDGDWVYSENVIFCRDAFFCCDHAQSCPPAERLTSWPDEQRLRWEMRRRLFPGLPDHAVILANFNQLYKIDPTTFRSWLRILSRVSNAFLWLLRFPELGEANLMRTAIAWAGPDVASRIIFTAVAAKPDHIARARVCDLFLDTPECNAHTTSADVLWSSTPLLTLPRYPYKMCSRMATSILWGALPAGPERARAAADLIAADEDQYEQFAIRLATGLRYEMMEDGHGEARGRLAELRRLLFDSKWTCALFDTRRWVSETERAYEEAWRRWVEGEGGDIYL